MKNSLFILSTVLSIGIFSGCSIAPAGNTENAVRSFTLSQSVWKSTDGGKTWEVKNKGEGKANATNVEILSFAINPLDSGNIYAGLRQGGILETKNGGDTWKFMDNFQSEKVYGLFLTPDGKTLYASAVWQETGKIFKTEDGGASWKEIYTSPGEGPLIISLIIDEKKPNVIYATTSNKEALKSVDGGTSWKNIHLANAPILKIALDAKNSDLIYSLTNAGSVFRSADGGESFEDISRKVGQSLSGSGLGLGGNQFSVLEADPSLTGRVYLAGAGGIAVSEDGGENWKKISPLNDSKNFPIKALAVSPANSQEILTGAAGASYKSSDGGATWMTFQFDNKMAARVLTYDPKNPNVVYLGFIK